MARALAGLAEVSVALGDRPAALQYFREAWRVASEARVTPVAMEVLAGLADLLAGNGASAPTPAARAYSRYARRQPRLRAIGLSGCITRWQASLARMPTRA